MATPHNSLRILFADDEKSLQEFMRSELPRLGHEVTVCPDGKAALKAMEKATFDAAILDLRMPGKTGFEVLEHLRRRALPIPKRIAILTSFAQPADILRSYELGAHFIAHKEADFRPLVHRLDRAMADEGAWNKADAPVA